MKKLSTMLAATGMVVALSACGSTDTTRAATGAGTGAVAGAVVGGPVGAVVGGVGGAAAGASMDEGAEKKAQRYMGRDGSGSTASQSGRDSSSSTRAMSAERVRNVQQALNDRGQTVDVDGVWGPNTRRALREFQQANGIDATGRLDNRTATALNLNERTNGSGRTGDPANTGTGTTGGSTRGTIEGTTTRTQ